MSSGIPRGRAGRKGQQHSASPRLRSYDVPPASPVAITRPDGTTEQQPARPAKTTSRPPRRRGPAVCAMCGEKITGTPVVSKDQTVCGKPVHGECEEKSLAWVAERRAQKRLAQPEGPAERRRARNWLTEENERLREAQDAMRRQ